YVFGVFSWLFFGFFFGHKGHKEGTEDNLYKYHGNRHNLNTDKV
ncbi:MAG: hypothetical protein ACI8P3_003692, partial [Saprospiraceae bacterium]